MLGEHHDIGKDFPGLKDKIHELKLSNRHFANVFEQYQKVNDEIYRIEEQIDAASDERTEELKKQRVKLKDEIFTMLNK